MVKQLAIVPRYTCGIVGLGVYRGSKPTERPFTRPHGANVNVGVGVDVGIL